MDMDRRSFLKSKMTYSEEIAIDEAKKIDSNLFTDQFNGCVVDIRVSTDQSKNYNGGDYGKWVEFYKTNQTGVYFIDEDWTSEYDINDYCHLSGYIVMTLQDFIKLNQLEMEE